MQSLVFNLPFQIVNYHPILGNNYTNVFPLVVSSWSCSRRAATIHCIVYTRYSHLKTDYCQNNKIRINQGSKKYVTYIILLFWIFSTSNVYINVFWGSLGTSIFGSSSSTANITRTTLPSRLSFRLLWL